MTFIKKVAELRDKWIGKKEFITFQTAQVKTTDKSDHIIGELQRFCDHVRYQLGNNYSLVPLWGNYPASPHVDVRGTTQYQEPRYAL